jgi:hypothetical protein
MSTTYSPNLVTRGLILCLDSQNPKSYMTGSLSWVDLSNNRNNGISYYSSSVAFNGTANTLFTSNSLNGLPDLTGSFTICCWINYNSTASYSAYFEKQNSSQASPVVPRMDLGHLNGTTYFTTYDTAANSIDGGQFGFNMSSNRWYNMVLACSSGSKNVYIDTVPKFNNTASCSWPDSTQVLGIRGSVRKFNGNVGLVLIYSRQLSLDEITKNFVAVRTKYNL